MATASSTCVGIASTVAVLSKATWRVRISLSKLEEDAEITGCTIATLSEEIKSLGLECDQVYSTVEVAIRKHEPNSYLRYPIDNRLLDSLAMQVDEACQTIDGLELFVKAVRGEKLNSIGQAQRLRKVDQSRDKVTKLRTNIGRHTESLRLTLLLISTLFFYHTPEQSQHELLHRVNELQGAMTKLQRSSDADRDSRISHTEIILVQYAQEVTRTGIAMYETALAAESATRTQSHLASQGRIAQWVTSLELVRQDRRRLDRANMPPQTFATLPREGTRNNLANTTSARCTIQESEAAQTKADDSDDDLQTDLARAALDTGIEAFAAQEWDEAEMLLNEALKLLRQLPVQKRGFCDIFGLHYRLAICSYHTQEPAVSEEALMSLVQQQANSDEQRAWVFDATHLLSQLYIRNGQIEQAKVECEKALHARRRLLGKQNDASLESLALMSHVYVLQDNRALAKSCLAMIPETRRDSILSSVEASLGPTVEHLDYSSLLNPSAGEDFAGSETATLRSESRLSSLGTGLKIKGFTPSPTFSAAHSPAPGHVQPTRSYTSSPGQTSRSIPIGAPSLGGSMSDSISPKEVPPSSEDNTSTTVFAPVATPPAATLRDGRNNGGSALTRKEILEKVGCQPRDRIEEAVCTGDQVALIKLLDKKKSFWRTSLRKRVRPERVTALHFAALFGEVEMARRLISSDYNVNEIPFGYSTSLTPLHFAIGARQVNMVEFLIASGAKPSKPDTWSSLAGQLMSRSWLIKTMSEAEKDLVPTCIMNILSILLKYGWNINEPIDTSGKTILHQAVCFWTGSYMWDLDLRVTITSFLCEGGANPFQANSEGKTSYDLASASGHQLLMLALDKSPNRNNVEHSMVGAVELSGRSGRSF